MRGVNFMKLRIAETSGENRAKRLFKNPEYMNKIKTFAIFTAENRDKKDFDSDVNKTLNRSLKVDLAYDKDKAFNKYQQTKSDKTLKKLYDTGISTDSLEKDLKLGHFGYYKVKGKYGNIEHSFIVYNLTLDDAKDICRKHGQQSFIFAYNNNGNLKFEFWANASKSGYSYKKVDEKEEFNIMDDDAPDYYTQIARDFKINIPFDNFEVSADDMIERIFKRKHELGYSDSAIQKLIDESTNPDYYKKGRYFARGTLIKY
jgi:hypothetical protein